MSLWLMIKSCAVFVDIEDTFSDYKYARYAFESKASFYSAEISAQRPDHFSFRMDDNMYYYNLVGPIQATEEVHSIPVWNSNNHY